MTRARARARPHRLIATLILLGPSGAANAQAVPPSLSPPAPSSGTAPSGTQPGEESITPAMLQQQLASAERRAADAVLPARERELAADRAIETRRELIRITPDADAALPELQTAQAAALLGRLARDGADSAVIFGLPTPAQRAAVRAAAIESADLLSQAARLSQALLERLGGAGSDQPEARDAEQLTTVRVPFHRARAEVLLAALNEGDQRRTHAQTALDAIGRLSLVNAGPEAARRVAVATAILHKNTPPGPEELTAAADEIAWVFTAPEAAASPVPAVTRAEAWLALVWIAEGQQRLDGVLRQVERARAAAPFADPQGRPDALVAVLLADTLTRLAWSRGIRESSAEALARAAQYQAELLRRQDLPVRSEQLVGLAYEKLSWLPLPSEATLEIPPLVRLARAIIAARDPSQRELSMAQLDMLAADASAGDLAADALWESAVLRLMPRDGEPEASAAARLEAGEALISLAKRFPMHTRARQALSAGVRHVRLLAMESNPGDARVNTVAKGLYRGAIDLITDSFPTLEQIDLWRYERGRLAWADLSAGTIDATTLLGAVKAMRAIPPESRDMGVPSSDVIRLGEQLQVALVDRSWATLRDLRKAGREADRKQFALDVLANQARLSREWAEARKSTLVDRFDLDWAEGLIESGDLTGEPRLRELVERADTLPGGRARVEVALARARLTSRDPEGAFALLRAAADRDDVPLVADKPSSRSEAFWQAWTLMLELLHVRPDAAQRAGTIRAQLRRLESIDPELGSEPWRGRLRKVSQAVERLAPAAPAAEPPRRGAL